MTLLLLNMIATFGVFSAVCFRLYECRRPRSWDGPHLTEWVAFLLVHVCIGVPMLSVLADQIGSQESVSRWNIVVMKMALAVLLLAPWHRRELER